MNQERIFKFLWPDKCWHECRIKENPGKCVKCGFEQSEFLSSPVSSRNPDLTTPDGMVMILGRLVEMGYQYSIVGDSMDIFVNLKNFKTSKHSHAYADTPPLAVLAAVESLIEKEGE